MSMPQTTTTPKWMIWTGRVISALPVLMLLMGAYMSFSMPDDNKKEMAKMGWDVSIAPALGVVILVVVALYVIPQTAVLGAILMTGYLGGAVATHVRVGDYGMMAPAIVVGVLTWIGLYLRDHRVRNLAPLRKLND
jgi:DoxX-like family